MKVRLISISLVSFSDSDNPKDRSCLLALIGALDEERSEVVCDSKHELS